MEDLFQHIIPVNEGYDYLFSDLVYVPIYETSLLVTKRTIMPTILSIEELINRGMKERFLKKRVVYMMS